MVMEGALSVSMIMIRKISTKNHRKIDGLKEHREENNLDAN
jgi:hypothetical protein